MTKPGYTHIIVPKHLHLKLKAAAKQHGLSINQLIAKLLQNINTSINTAPTYRSKPSLKQTLNKNQSCNQACFYEREGMETVGCHQVVGPPGFEPGIASAPGWYPRPN